MIEYTAQKLDDTDESLWNEGIASATGGFETQTTFFAKTRRAAHGGNHLFLTAKAGQKIVGQFYVFGEFAAAEALLHKPLTWLTLPLANRLFASYTWEFGPVIHTHDDSEEVLRTLLHCLDRKIKKSGGIAVKSGFPCFYDPNIELTATDKIFAEYGFQIDACATIALNVQQDLETLWNALESETRRKIRKARKQGVRIFEVITPEDLKRFQQVREETARRSGVYLPYSYQTLLDIQKYYPSGIYRIFLAEHDGHVVAGQAGMMYNDVVRLTGVSDSDYARTNKIPGNDFMQWHMIEWAREQGYRLVDWHGYTVNPSTEKERGINRFKAKWGGDVLEYNNYSKIYAPRRYRLYQQLKQHFRNA